jgi:hypothetical protein
LRFKAASGVLEPLLDSTLEFHGITGVALQAMATSQGHLLLWTSEEQEPE